MTLFSEWLLHPLFVLIMSESHTGNYRATKITDIVDIRPDVTEDTAYPKETVSRIFTKVCKERGDIVALVGCNDVTYTWNQYYDNATNFARSLIHIGVNPFDSVAIIGFNSPEYVFSVMGCSLVGGVATAIYSTNTPDAVYYVMNHSHSTTVVVDGKYQLGKVLEIRDRLPFLKMIVVYNSANMTIPEDEEGVAKVRTWENFLTIGSEVEDAIIAERIENQQAGQCLTLIYTSGTTGNPKAVMISNDNCIFVCRVIIAEFHFGVEDRMVSFLPLSHIAAQMVDIFASCIIGFKIYFARPDALKGSLVDTLKKAKPTIFVTVPRVFEKMMESVNAKLSAASGFKKMIARFCRKRASIHMNNIQVGQSKQRLTFYNLANKLMLSKIKQALGLECAKLLYSAAAPIDMSTLQFFASFDIPVFEIFGMSESCGPCSFHTRNHWKMGTAGQTMHGSIVKTVPGSNEIIMYGRHVFMGYLMMPDETKRAIDDDGFLHSGDCGVCDADGFWKITGRIKELIVTAGGENIPPVLIESEIKQLAPCISNAVLIGDKRKFLSVLLTLQCRVDGDSEGKEGELLGESLEIAAKLGSKARTVAEASVDPLFIQFFHDIIEQYNNRAFSNAQKIQKFSILKRDFSLNTGELTPTLKMKRNFISSAFSEEIESMYN